MSDRADAGPPRGPSFWDPPGWAAVSSVVVLVVVSIDVLLDGPLRRFDQSVADLMWRLGVRDDPQGGVVGYVFSQTGGRVSNLVWVVALCLGVGIVHRTYAPLLRLSMGMLLLTGTIYLGKWLFGRTAPAFGADLLHQAGRVSFPSGHQANAVLISGIGAWIASEYVRSHWLRTVIRVYAATGPCVAAVAVLLMNYHWLTDVVAGFAVGLILLWLVHRILSGRLGRLGPLPATLGRLLSGRSATADGSVDS